MIKTFLLLILLVSISSGCRDNSHSDLAKNFVSTLNLESNYNVELLKTHTKQSSYILVQDRDTNQIDAYDLSGYTESSDISDYLASNQDRFYFDLEFYTVEESYYFVQDNFGYYDPIYGYHTFGPGGYYEVSYENVYRDPSSGILFSKSRMTTSDLSKALEIVDGIRLNKAIDKLTIQFGLEPKIAKKVAGYGLALSKLKPEQMTVYNFDRYTKAILASKFTDIQSAMELYKSGDDSELQAIYKKAAKINKLSVREVEQLANLFIKN